MFLRITTLILLSSSLAFAIPVRTELKTARSDRNIVTTKEKIVVKTIGTNTAKLMRLDNEGFTVRLDCSKFAAERATDTKAFLLDPNVPEECQKTSPAYGQRVLILINSIPKTPSKSDKK